MLSLVLLSGCSLTDTVCAMGLPSPPVLSADTAASVQASVSSPAVSYAPQPALLPVSSSPAYILEQTEAQADEPKSIEASETTSTQALESESFTYLDAPVVASVEHESTPNIAVPVTPSPVIESTPSIAAPVTPSPVIESTPNAAAPVTPSPKIESTPSIEGLPELQSVELESSQSLELVTGTYAASLPPADTTLTDVAPEQLCRVPTISISDFNLPADMVRYGVFNLEGIISVDCGVISSVSGSIHNSNGELVQEALIYPNSSQVDLIETVNPGLSFASLSPDTYIYQIVATAVNGNASTEKILISHSFIVSSHSVYINNEIVIHSYSAKTVEETDNIAIIWNYFINKFQNPYAVAAIVGNIYSESECDPMRVEADYKGKYSVGYTKSVDSGTVSREDFLYSPGEGYGLGYGLCQWTEGRKLDLYDFALSSGSSIGDLHTQCDFIMSELEEDYPALLEYLYTTDDAQAATFEFCSKFERPSVYGNRNYFALSFLEKYAT